MNLIAGSESKHQIVTAAEIRSGVRGLGIQGGDTMLVHCALSAFGHVPGGEQSVVEALCDAVGPSGTVVMPAQSWQLCDPDFLDDPLLDSDSRTAVRNGLPPFDRATTPTRTMGRVAELFRTRPGAMRSPHPHRSFSACGPAAADILADQPLDDPFGERSPLARLYERGAIILLLGVGYSACTALHLAERRLTGPARRRVPNGAPLSVDGKRTWVNWCEPEVDDRAFARVGEDFEATGRVHRGSIGPADCRAVPLAGLVDFAQQRLPMINPI
jgi:aminoglycoside 3-N-acetyltransferase